MFRYKLMQFMYGRHGNDQLNMFLIIIMFAVAIINLFFHSVILYFIQTLCFVLYLLRFFSKNNTARNSENDKFVSIYSKLAKKNDYNTVNTNNHYTSSKSKKDPGYKYFKCPNCSAKLRVPRKKGKITITCPKCRTSFKGKS